MLDAILIAVVALSAVWVYLDATKNKIGEIPDSKGMFNVSAGAWGSLTLLLWVIGFPAYLIKRGRLIERAKENPIEVTGRGGKAAALSIVGGSWVLLSVSGIVSSALPDCDNPKLKSAIEQITMSSPLAKLSAAAFITVKNEIELGYNQSAQIRSCRGTVVTTAGEDVIQYDIGWGNKEETQFEVEGIIQ